MRTRGGQSEPPRRSERRQSQETRQRQLQFKETFQHEGESAHRDEDEENIAEGRQKTREIVSTGGLEGGWCTAPLAGGSLRRQEGLTSSLTGWLP